MKKVYMDQIRLSKTRHLLWWISTPYYTTNTRFDELRFRSSNINSTFGSQTISFSTDGHTVMLLNGDEGYSNTFTGSGNTFP